MLYSSLAAGLWECLPRQLKVQGRAQVCTACVSVIAAPAAQWSQCLQCAAPSSYVSSRQGVYEAAQTSLHGMKWGLSPAKHWAGAAR